MKTISVPQSNIPVAGEFDVVVCGGGTAGVFAAVAAADEGCSVCVIEQFGSLGGSATNGLVTPVMSTHIKEEPECSYIAGILNSHLRKINGVDDSGRVFDPLFLKFASEELCDGKNIKLFYHSFVCGVVKDDNKLKGVIIATKSGTSAVMGKMFIDCTGDGDLSVLSGAEYTKGNPETGKNQPISLRYIVGGVDKDAMRSFLKSEVERTGINSAVVYDNSNLYASVTAQRPFTLTDIFDQAIKNGDLVEEDKMYWQLFNLRARKYSVALNNPEFFDYVDGTDTDHLTYTQVHGKKAIMRQLNFYKKYMKGFDDAYIEDVAAMVGIRESRNITTEYVLTGEELLGKRKFDDAISQSNYPVDIHGKVLNFSSENFTNDDGKPYYEIPFRALVVKGFDNLFVAGRCLGAEFLAQSAIRIQHTMRASGEAAGIGAALAVKKNTLPKEIDGSGVRKIMMDKGARFIDR